MLIHFVNVKFSFPYTCSFLQGQLLFILWLTHDLKLLFYLLLLIEQRFFPCDLCCLTYQLFWTNYYIRGNMVDAFRMHIMQTKELGTCPVRQIGGCSFFYMRISNVYIVIVVSSNANVACAFKFVVEVIGILLLLKFPSSLPSLVFHVSHAIVSIVSQQLRDVSD